MTTIVWDGKMLAADSKTTCEHRVVNIKANKLMLVDKTKEVWSINDKQVLAVGLAGDSGAIGPLRHLLRLGICYSTEFPRTYLFQALAIDVDANAYLLTLDEENVTLHITELDGPDSIGSGEHFASAVLHLGHDAEKAVEVACALDVNSGGAISTWVHPKYRDATPCHIIP